MCDVAHTLKNLRLTPTVGVGGQEANSDNKNNTEI